MNSEQKYRLIINVENTSKSEFSFNEVIINYIKIKVYSASNELIGNKYGKFDKRIDSGIYYVRAEFNGLFEDLPLFLLDKDQIFSIKSPKFYSSLPITGFESTHEYYSEIVHRTFRKNISKTALLLFLRFPNHKKYQQYKSGEYGVKYIKTDPFQGFSLIDNNGKTIKVINSKKAESSNEFGWMIFDKILKEGIYFLRYEEKNQFEKKKAYRLIPFYIYPNWQTHIFVTFNPNPVFETLRISFKNGDYFSNQTQISDLHNEILLQNIENKDYELPPKILDYAGYEKWENPIFGILAVFSYIKNSKHNDDSFIEKVMHNLDGSIFPESSPDVIILRIMLKKHFKERWIGQYKIENPPLFKFLYEELILLSAEDTRLISVNSLSDLISTFIFKDSIFTTFKYDKSFPKLNIIDDSDELTNKIKDMIKGSIAQLGHSNPIDTDKDYLRYFNDSNTSNQTPLQNNLFAQSQIKFRNSSRKFQQLQSSFLPQDEESSIKKIVETYNIPSPTVARAISFNQQSEITQYIDNNRDFLESNDLNESFVGQMFANINQNKINKTSETMATLDKKNYVNVGPNGTFKPSDTPEFDTTPDDIDAMFGLFKEKGTKKIVIYFHGGLVGLNIGMETADKITNWISKTTDAHPVTFVWETGPFRTIWDNINDISNTKFFDEFKKKIIKKVGERLGVDLASKGAVKNMSDTEIAAELKKEAPFEDFTFTTGARATTIIDETDVDKINETNSAEFQALEMEFTDEFAQEEDAYKVYVDETLNKNFVFLEEEKIADTNIVDPASRGIFSSIKLAVSAAKIVIRVIKRIINKRDHGFYPTIIEEILREFYLGDIGSWVWGGMKEKAEKMWGSNTGISGLDQHAGRYFFDKLYEYCNSNANIEVTVIGHSAGSIATAHLLDINGKSPKPIQLKNFIYFAPACRCDLFHEKVLPNKNLIENFRMFTMADAFETKDHMLSFFYTRSLLYLIAGILEDNGESFDQYILGLQRHIDLRKPYNNVTILNKINTYLTENGKNRQVFSVVNAAPKGLNSTSTTHGGFDDDKHDSNTDKYSATLDSVSYMIMN